MTQSVDVGRAAEELEAEALPPGGGKLAHREATNAPGKAFLAWTSKHSPAGGLRALKDSADAVQFNRDWIERRLRVLGPSLRRVSLHPRHGSVRGNVLLSWLTEAFSSVDGKFAASHANLWECRQVARTFLELGFHVDVINYRNILYRPRRRYDFLIDNRLNMERLAPFLGEGCIKIHHIETSHMLFQNAAEYRRLLELQQRRGVTLRPRRVERKINRCIEHADCGVLYGGDHSARTWLYAGKSMYPVPGTPARQFDSPARKNFEKARRNFLWIGSSGSVLKGLDLVLEAFAGMPHYTLTVCGPVNREDDFAAAYRRELYETPNITTLGWVDVNTREFERVLHNTLGLVYPSASESQSGSVITCLHAGLIPILTRECDVAVPGKFGRVLPLATVESIRAAVREVAELPAGQLREMAMGAWMYARSTHTRGRFAKAYRAIIEGLLGEGEMPPACQLQHTNALHTPAVKRPTIFSTV